MEPPDIPDFRLVQCIGEGGFGEIWLGLDALDIHRAIKVVRHAKFESDEETAEKQLDAYQSEYYGIKKYAPISNKYDILLDIRHVGINDEKGFYFYVMDLADDLATNKAVVSSDLES